MSLAIDGGEKSVHATVPPWPISDPEILEAIRRSFESGDWGRYHGPAIEELEAKIALLAGSKHAKSCSSGTIAVELGLRALKVGNNDRVILAGYDFPGNFRSVEAVGATPILVDVSSGGWTIDLDKLESIDSANAKAIVVSHLHGDMVPMKRLMEWARINDIAVVEDACQCPGAIVDSKPVGGWGDIGVFSFGGSKLLSSGRGGALVTNEPSTMQRVRILAERGNDAFPLSELQATALIPQLARLDERNECRLLGAIRLSQRLAECGWARLLGSNLRSSFATDDSHGISLEEQSRRPAFYKLPFTLPDSDEIADQRAAVIRAANAEGIAIDIGFRGFAKRSSRRCETPLPLRESIRAAERTLLLHHPVLLTPESLIDSTAEGIAKVISHLICPVD